MIDGSQSSAALEDASAGFPPGRELSENTSPCCPNASRTVLEEI
jgi:hypothetical protein